MALDVEISLSSFPHRAAPAITLTIALVHSLRVIALLNGCRDDRAIGTAA